jgi:glycosyltransferase involved in cell wall biosynthesis
MKERASARIYDEDELRWLFANAQLFIYPSIYEGFGIPILDAFSLGCPVLLANASCFPEVGGDAALYFDPQDEDALREQLMRVIGIDAETKRMRADLIARGKERAKMFSWQKCAAETAEIYRHLVKDPER